MSFWKEGDEVKLPAGNTQGSVAEAFSLLKLAVDDRISMSERSRRVFPSTGLRFLGAHIFRNALEEESISRSIGHRGSGLHSSQRHTIASCCDDVCMTLLCVYFGLWTGREW